MPVSLSVSCPHCKHGIKLKSAASVGKKARCPKCQEVFVVPAVEAEEEDEFAGLMGAGANEFEDYDGDDDGEADASSEAAPTRSKSGRSKKGKKKKKSSSGGGGAAKALMIACGVLLVLGLLGGGGFLLIKYLPLLGYGPPSRLAWLPDTTEEFMEIRVADLWNAAALQPLKNAQLTTNLTDSVMNEYGIRPEEIDKLVLGKPSGAGAAAGSDVVAVVYSKTPITEQQRSTITGGTPPNEYKEVKYYLIPRTGRAIYFPKENVVVYGSEQRIVAAIDAKGKCAAEERFAAAPVGHHFTLVSLNTAGGTQNASSIPGVTSLSADTLKSAAVMIDADADLRLGTDLVCVSADKAAEAARELTAAREKQVAEFSQQKAKLQQAAAAMAALNGQGGGNAQANLEKTQNAMNSLEQSLQSVQATSNGETVHASITVSGQTIAALADLVSMFTSSLPGMIGRGASPTLPMPGQPTPTYPGR